MMGSSSSTSGSSSSPPLPTRRRIFGAPLHPLNRAPPSTSSLSYASAEMSSKSNANSPPSTSSVFMAPSYSRKRNLYANPTLSSPTRLSFGVSTLDSHFDLHSQRSNASPTFDFRLSPAKANHYSFGGPTTSPIRAPYGEFSFQAQAPSSDRHSSDTRPVETSSMAFAKLAQAQRAQQEAQRQIASGDRIEEGPAAKRRKGVAGILVDSALSAVIYTGAAAVTAYSLWSSWGLKGQGEQSVAEETSQNREKMPPGGLEEPPPPYIDHLNKSATSSKLPMSSPRPGHVFVSSRRRRPAFKSHKSLQTSTPKSTVPQPSQTSFTPAPVLTSNSNFNEDDDMDNDDTFARMQAKMAKLIEEGNRALHSQADLDDKEQPTTPNNNNSTQNWSCSNNDASTSASQNNAFESRYTQPSVVPTQPLVWIPNILADSSNTSPSTYRSPSSRGGQAWPYSRIPRLGSNSNPPTNKSRY